MKLTRNKKTALLLLIILAVIIVSSIAVEAALPQSIQRIGSWLSPEEGKAKLIDYAIFFAMFATVAYLGFSTFFKEGSQGAVLGLSLAVGAALSVALVAGAKLTLTRIAPVAMILVAVLIFIGLFGLFRRILGNGAGKTALALILALICTFLILFLATLALCQNNACDKNPFLKKLLGSGSFFGSLFSGWNLPGMPSLPSPDLTLPPPQVGTTPTLTPAHTPPKVPSDLLTDDHFATGTTLGLVALLGAWFYLRKRKQGKPRKPKKPKPGKPDDWEIEIEEEYEVEKLTERLIDEIDVETDIVTVAKQVLKTFFESLKHPDETGSLPAETIGGIVEAAKQHHKQVMPELNKIKKLNNAEIKIAKKIVTVLRKELDALRVYHPDLEKAVEAAESIEKEFERMNEIIERLESAKEDIIKKTMSSIEQFKFRIGDIRTHCQNAQQIIEQEIANYQELEEPGRSVDYRTEHESLKTLLENFKKLEEMVSKKKEMAELIHEGIADLHDDVKDLVDIEKKELEEQGLLDEAEEQAEQQSQQAEAPEDNAPLSDLDTLSRDVDKKLGDLKEEYGGVSTLQKMLPMCKAVLDSLRKLQGKQFHDLAEKQKQQTLLNKYWFTFNKILAEIEDKIIATKDVKQIRALFDFYQEEHLNVSTKMQEAVNDLYRQAGQPPEEPKPEEEGYTEPPAHEYVYTESPKKGDEK